MCEESIIDTGCQSYKNSFKYPSISVCLFNGQVRAFSNNFFFQFALMDNIYQTEHVHLAKDIVKAEHRVTS